MRGFRPHLNPKPGFTFIELLVAMVIVSFIGGAIFVTFSQGVRVWRAAVREGGYDKQEFFFEELKSELRNAFFYGKSSINGQNQMIEFYTLVPRISSKKKAIQIPAQIRYRFMPALKLIQKETTFYEKMLNPKSSLQDIKPVLTDIADFYMEYYWKPEKGSSASWVRQWRNTCFPEAVKVTLSNRTAENSKEIRIISIPTRGECIEDESDKT